MVVVQLKGGLGNQCFQYAAALSLARQKNTVAKVDIEQLNRKDAAIGTFRAFDLQNIIASPLVASIEEINALRPTGISRLIDKILPPHRRKEYKEADYYFDKNFFNSNENVYLKGYRQSEKYFLPVAAEVRRIFKIKPELLTSVSAFANRVYSCNSVAIHIRRGDYNNPVVQAYHGMLDKDYYQAAIDRMKKSLPDAIFFVFTDDVEWVKKSLRFDATVEYVSGEITKNQFEDFHLISQCKHQIIANSTFSWWAAWLNDYPQKIVIAPEKWFKNAPYDTRDLIPPGWIKI